MPSLRELQTRFSDAVLAADAMLPAFARGDAAAAAERMAIYRRTITSNYRNALGATYPVLKRLLGTPSFNAAVDAYVEAEPSRSGDLNVYGDTFGDFLAHYAPAAEWPYLPDVARLEWAIDEANRAPDASAAPDAVLGALTVLPADQLPGLTFALDPSCRLIASPFPLLRIWQVNQPDHGSEVKVDWGVGRDHLRVRREPPGVAIDGVAIERLPAGDFAFLSALQVSGLGKAMERAQDADARFDLSTALHRFIGDGTIVGVGDASVTGIRGGPD